MIENRRWLDHLRRLRGPSTGSDSNDHGDIPLDSAALYALFHLACELLQEDDYDKLLDVLMQRSLSMLGGERGFIVLNRGEGLDFKVVRNWRPDELEGDGEPVSRSIVADVLSGKAPVLIEDAASDLRYAKNESVLRHRIRSVLAAPLEVDGEAVGAVYLETGDLGGLFGPRQLDLFHHILELSDRALARCTRLLLLEQRNRQLESAAHSRFRGILTRDPAFLAILETVSHVATTDTTVLIQGPSGTGKELVARAVHLNSRRNTKPFVTVNCGAISPTLLESELFGHLRGAFTGADRDKVGLLPSAEHGTVFLDEVGELPLEMQVKLLRAVQFGEVRPVGAAEALHVDVRFLAATNRDLQTEVAAGRFREDLLYRLNVVTLELPPLCDRPVDIPLLFYHFLHKSAETAGRPVPEVTPDLERALLSYGWPGNVRQLENEAERLLAVTPLGVGLQVEHLSSRITAGLGGGSAPASLVASERELILHHLRATNGNKTRAAESLGISREGLRKKMIRLDLTWPPED